MNLKKTREAMLPQIKDWTSEHLDLKYAPNIKKQKFETWFWFSVENYKIIKVGFPAMFVLITLTLTYVLRQYEHNIIAVLTFITALLGIIALVNTLSQYNMYKDTNMYEQCLMDKPEEVWEMEVK